MTVVCYDGELLAADRMSRIVLPNGERATSSLSKEKISTSFEGICFDGEAVLAVGRAGRVKVSKTLIRLLCRKNDLALKIDSVSKALKKKFSPEEMNDPKPSLKKITGALKKAIPIDEMGELNSALDKVTDAVYGRLSSDEEKPTASLIIVTSNHVHLLRVFSDFRTDWQKMDPSKKIAIGSGKIVASFLMEHLGVNAIDAVASMELENKSCGGGVTYTSRTLASFDTPVLAIPHRKRDVLKKRLLRVSAHSTVLKLRSLPE